MIEPPIIREHNGIMVVRDDLLAGGTKRRVLERILRPGNEYVYASPAYGYAQVALASAAAAVGALATVFVAKRSVLHPLTKQAHVAGAQVIQIPHGYMSNVTAKARAYCEQTGATLLPFGMDIPEMLGGIAEVASRLGIQPSEVWSVAGSGTLTRSLQQAWPGAAFHAVRIGALPKHGRAHLWTAPEDFENPARIIPPFPSCVNYDAKAWRFICEHASPGALFWNVAA